MDILNAFVEEAVAKLGQKPVPEVRFYNNVVTFV
jgi:hypothetical protein